MSEYDETILANEYLDTDYGEISIGMSFIENKDSMVKKIKKAIEELPEIIQPDKFEYKFLHKGEVLRIEAAYTYPRPHFEGYTALELARFLYKQIKLRLED